jgi:hypothetical protein
VADNDCQWRAGAMHMSIQLCTRAETAINGEVDARLLYQVNELRNHCNVNCPNSISKLVVTRLLALARSALRWRARSAQDARATVGGVAEESADGARRRSRRAGRSPASPPSDVRQARRLERLAAHQLRVPTRSLASIAEARPYDFKHRARYFYDPQTQLPKAPLRLQP